MTFYQKVKQALGLHAPTTFANLADAMEADSEAVRLTLAELKRRGKATADPNMLEEVRLWSPAEN